MDIPSEPLFEPDQKLYLEDFIINKLTVLFWLVEEICPSDKVFHTAHKDFDKKDILKTLSEITNFIRDLKCKKDC